MNEETKGRRNERKSEGTKGRRNERRNEVAKGKRNERRDEGMNEGTKEKRKQGKMEVGMDLWKLYFFRLLSYPNPLHTTYSQVKRERKSCQKNYTTKQYTTCGMKFCRAYFCESAIFCILRKLIFAIVKDCFFALSQ